LLPYITTNINGVPKKKGGGFAPVHRDLDRSVREKGVGDTANSRVYKSIGKCPPW
jgi:hypothetical protein